ncbi:unnamed protein product, partial [Rangifer tarandus platyrhynchus]
MPVLKPTCGERQLHSRRGHSDEKLVQHSQRVVPALHHSATETQRSRVPTDINR